MRILNDLFSEAYAREVEALLLLEDISFFSRVRIPGEYGTQISVLTFLNYLFARSTAEVTAQFSPINCAELISKVFLTLTALNESHEQLVVHQDRIATQDSFIIALTDSPFIVSTVAERLSEADLDVFAFLHPVLHFLARAITQLLRLLRHWQSLNH